MNSSLPPTLIELESLGIQNCAQPLIQPDAPIESSSYQQALPICPNSFYPQTTPSHSNDILNLSTSKMNEIKIKNSNQIIDIAPTNSLKNLENISTKELLKEGSNEDKIYDDILEIKKQKYAKEFTKTSPQEKTLLTIKNNNSKNMCIENKISSSEMPISTNNPIHLILREINQDSLATFL